MQHSSVQYLRSISTQFRWKICVSLSHLTTFSFCGKYVSAYHILQHFLSVENMCQPITSYNIFFLWKISLVEMSLYFPWRMFCYLRSRYNLSPFSIGRSSCAKGKERFQFFTISCGTMLRNHIVLPYSCHLRLWSVVQRSIVFLRTFSSTANMFLQCCWMQQEAWFWLRRKHKHESDQTCWFFMYCPHYDAT
jgi:hypothetical protein